MPEEQELNNIAQLIAKRGVIKSQLTKLTTFVTNFKKGEDDINQIKVRVNKLHKHYDDFSNLQTEIEVLDNKNTKKHESERDSVDTQYFTCLTNINAILESGTGTTTTPIPNSQGRPKGLPVPEIKPPVFKGTFSTWPSFYNTFNALIHENGALSNVEKFHHLKACLTDDAAKTIQSLSVTEDNYMIAIKALEKRYNNKRLIVQEHVCFLINLTPITKATHINLRKILDDLLVNIQALKTLNEPVEQWNALIVPIITSKLDFITKKEFEATLTTEIAKLDDLLQFLEKRCQLLESLEAMNAMSLNSNVRTTKPIQPYNSMNNSNNSKRYTTLVNTHNHYEKKCAFCKLTGHAIYHCDKFKELSAAERFSSIKELKFCTNCLRPHSLQSCKSNSKCRQCNKQHHTLLHRETVGTSQINKSVSETEQHEEDVANSSAVVHHSLQQTKQILLSTAEIKIANQHGVLYTCRALLDNASQSSFISKSLCKRLGLHLKETNIPVEGVNKTSTNINKRARIMMHNVQQKLISPVDCLVVDKVTQNLPLHSFPISNINLPQDIKLADSNFNISSPIDILLGADVYWGILREGFINGCKNHPPLLKTELGWILGGNLNSHDHIAYKNLKTVCNHSINALHDTMEKFWSIENLTTDVKSDEDLACDIHYKTTFKRETNGKFVVRLPFKKNKPELGQSKISALKRFYNLENKLRNDPKLRLEYVNFLSEYLRLGHMEIINKPDTINSTSFFLPHHAVFKESTTTGTRVVFDASMKSSTGLSLNDILMTGPNLQQDLFAILCRFRMYRYVISADIAKMYRQIKVDDADTDYQLILWRESEGKPIQTYRLLTVTYGTNCAPFLAIRTLHQLAEEEKQDYPEACSVLVKDFYMDDCLTGADSIIKIKVLREQLTEVLSRGGFELRKWITNAPEILENINIEVDPFVILDSNNTKKILGIYWNSQHDTLEYAMNLNLNSQIITKRLILSTISRIYDPLGLLQPIIVKLKVLMQKIWVSKVDWDDNIPTALLNIWSQCFDQFDAINNIKISRYLLYENTNAEIHGFCDASSEAYGCCIYVRTKDKAGNYHVKLLCAKSRVAPLKVLSIPRLELCGAVLLAQLMNNVVKYLNFPASDQYLWTDSTIVLAWLSAPAANWNVFVANRVALVQSLTNQNNWHYVNTGYNPADIVSRGLYPKQLKTSKLWWHGPEYLMQSNDRWPEEVRKQDNLPEKRKICLHNTEVNQLSLQMMQGYSTFIKLKRVVAFILRFINNIKGLNERIIGPLTTEEIENAVFKIVKLIQLKHFYTEYQQLEKQNELQKTSSLRTLNPFIDKNGVIRVGGRIQHSDINFRSKCPMILPKADHVTDLVIRYYHNKQLHAGCQGTLAALREQFWIVAGRSTVRKIIHKCIICFKNKPKSYNQIMGNLPKERLQPCRPFLKVGIDYAGPLFIKSNLLTRCKSNLKAYICVFVCMVTKAIHLELVTSLTTESFLNMLKRFISRRGYVTDIFSDNATNFRGANRELKEIFTFCRSVEFESVIKTKLRESNINWHFIPPRSPNFGGLWEAAVKSTKYHLKRVIGEIILNYEELYTLLTMIEAVLNSRPLSPLSEDPNDMETLTPSHFLIGEPLTALPQRNMENIPINRLRRYQHLERMRLHFWKRFTSEYLTQLQQRSKWQHADSNVTLNTLVLIKDNNLPPMRWLRGRIVKLHPGSDGIVRVISARLADGSVVKRGICNVCPLPIND